MLTAEQQEEVEYIKDRMLAKFPLLGVTLAKLDVEADDRAGTAYTTGSKICYSPKFFKTLSDDEELFIFAHEVFHVAFEHIARRKGYDKDLWNIATDAVINQLLQQEGLPIKEGLINIPEAQGHSAEEMYDLLLERRKEKQQEWQDHVNEMKKKAKEMAEKQREQQEQRDETASQEQNQHQEQSQPQQNKETQTNEQSQSFAEEQNKPKEQENPLDDWANQPQKQPQPQAQPQPNKETQPDGQSQPSTEETGETKESSNPLDDWANQPPMPELPEFKFNLPNHDIWEEVTKQQEELEKGKEKEGIEDEGNVMGDLEKQFHQQNQRELVKQAMEYYQSQGHGCAGTFHMRKDELSEAKPAQELNWKKLLKRNLDLEIETWSDRRADEENDFTSRLEEVEVEDKAHTEVMLDISGSVDVELLKEFLRQLKPLLKDSTLDVAYFNEEATDFTRVKTAKDIEKLNVPYPCDGTDLDVAVRKFSKNKRTNKIVFTDGYGGMPEDDLKNVNVIWVIYGHEVGEFKPCCGKVIYVDENKIMEEGSQRRSYLISQATGLSRK